MSLGWLWQVLNTDSSRSREMSSLWPFTTVTGFPQPPRQESFPPPEPVDAEAPCGSRCSVCTQHEHTLIQHLKFPSHFKMHFCISFVYVGLHASRSMCGAKDTNFESWFSPSSMWGQRRLNPGHLTPRQLPLPSESSLNPSHTVSIRASFFTSTW